MKASSLRLREANDSSRAGLRERAVAATVLATALVLGGADTTVAGELQLWPGVTVYAGDDCVSVLSPRRRDRPPLGGQAGLRVPLSSGAAGVSLEISVSYAGPDAYERRSVGGRMGVTFSLE